MKKKEQYQKEESWRKKIEKNKEWDKLKKKLPCTQQWLSEPSVLFLSLQQKQPVRLEQWRKTYYKDVDLLETHLKLVWLLSFRHAYTVPIDQVIHSLPSALIEMAAQEYKLPISAEPQFLAAAKKVSYILHQWSTFAMCLLCHWSQ